MIGLGDKVFLKACQGSGQPGVAVRKERNKMVVYWPDLDYWSRHLPDSLELAGDSISGPVVLPPETHGLPATLSELLELAGKEEL